MIVTTIESMKNTLSDQTNLNEDLFYDVSIIKLYSKTNIVVRASAKTKTSTTVIVGVGGIWSLMTGTKATMDTIIAAILTILLWRSASSKKIPKLIMDSSNKGKKIVRMPTTGFLKRGTRKLAALNACGFYFPEAFPFFAFLFLLIYFNLAFSSFSLDYPEVIFLWRRVSLYMAES